jgi:hypothetical protein
MLFGLNASPKSALKKADRVKNPLLVGWQRYMLPAFEEEQRRMEEYRRAFEEKRPITFEPLPKTPEESVKAMKRIVREPGMRAFRARDHFVRRFAWAVPTDEALQAIAKFSPIVEIGAGTGYWAWLLRRDYNVDILPYDHEPPQNSTENHYRHTRTFVPVLKGGPRKAKQFPQHALFLCWPPYRTSMADDCVRLYAGKHVIYIGEGHGGCNANDAFFERLEKDFEKIDDIAIPQWNGLHDALTIWKRK